MRKDCQGWWKEKDREGQHGFGSQLEHIGVILESRHMPWHDGESLGWEDVG